MNMSELKDLRTMGANTWRDLNRHFSNDSWPFVEVGDGWLPLVMETHQKLKELDPEYQILQIKEKFGGLRYYIHTTNEKAWKIVDEAEARSITICEKCGKPGKLRDTAWVTTLCDEHYGEEISNGC